MGLSERLFAKWYPVLAGLSENAGQAQLRAEVLSPARGRTLEVGAGNGFNLPHYPPAVTELVVSEPSPDMRAHLEKALAERPPAQKWSLVPARGERLPFEDASFDTVVGAYVLCSVTDPGAALREIARVLRPGGQYLFLEHVRSPGNRALGIVQDVVERPHTWIAAGCHPNRRFEQLLDASPLARSELVHGRMPKGFPTVAPIVHGRATRVA